MPINPTYPGVYIEELPSGVRTIAGVATSITAFVGQTLRGPINEPTIVNNYGDFERLFGGLWIKNPLSYAVKDFFGNGGSQALIVRLFKVVAGDVDPPTYTGYARFNVGGLQLIAASPGEWGGKLKVKIDQDGITDEVASRYNLTAADLFNLTIQDTSPTGGVETIRNLALADGERRVDRVLEQQSLLVRVPLESIAPRRPVLPATVPTPTDFTDPTVRGIDSVALDLSAYQGSEADKTGIYALEKADLFNLLCIPPDVQEGTTLLGAYQEALSYFTKYKKRAILIVDPPAEWSANKATAAATAKAGLSGLNLTGEIARNAVLYFPRVIQADPLRGGQLGTFVPCGMMAGIMARTDTQRGVWKAPAGLDATLAGIRGLEVNLSDAENGDLNPIGINCLRTFPIVGSVVWGARTMRGADQLADEYKYLPVRRLVLYLQESLYRGTQWVVFEPNDEPLWAQIRLNIGAFMNNLFRQGAFQGKTPREAYFVKCDKETTTQNDIDRGIVNIVVGFAPLKPAEFVIIKFQQIAGQIAV
jgi:phage tail sheath protein FI